MHIVLLLAVLTVSHNWTDVQAQYATSAGTNDTRMILNVKDNTVTLLNTTSNETISIRNLTAPTENITTDETRSTNNTTADTEKMATNETRSSADLTENAENSTTDLNLTERFKELQGQ